MDKHYEIDNARHVLRQHGYFVENLWHIDDVKANYDCDDDTAMDILEGALTNDAVYNDIWSAIDFVADNYGLKRK